jgi:hypothetical protein
MNKIEINVKNSDGSIIGKLDIGNAEINTVYQLVDIREPEKKSGDHTLTFTIPGTKINNGIFQHIYENGFSSFSYNPNKRLEAQILVDGNQYFIGYLQMNTTSKLDNKLIEYEVTIYGAFVSFFSDMADKSLRDIVDLSDYNHKYIQSSIIESWNKNIYQYGKKKTFQLGDGYVYPMEYRGQDDVKFVNMELFRPAIYVKTIFDRLLQKYGITYNSTFLTSEYFRRLIMPYSGDKNMGLTQDQIDNINTLANAPSPPNRPVLESITSKADRKYKDFAQITFPNDTILPAKDLGGNYDTTTSIMTVPKNGNYDLVAVVKLGIDYTGRKKDGSSSISPIRVRGGFITGKLRIVDVATKKDLKSTDFTFTSAAFNQSWKNTVFSSDDIDVTVSYTGPLTKGSRYKVMLDLEVPGSNYSYQTISGMTPAYPADGPAVETMIDVRLLSTPLGYPINPNDAPRFELALVDTNVTEGDMLDMNYFIPDMKAVDFIKEINKLFNLYWKPIGENKFIIEPRDTFYSMKTNILDWTYQVDNAKYMKIEPIYDLNYKEYNFSYTYDDDYYNKDYSKSYNETYGSKTITVDNDFVVEKINIKSSFSPTVIVNHLNSKRILPAMVASDGKTMNYYKAKQRILFYGGLIDPKFVPGTFLQFNTSAGEWYFKSPYSNIVIDQDLFLYPYAGHFDNPSNPRWDLNWGMSKKYYFSWNSICDNGLYNMFWRNYTEEMLDKNNHLLTAQIVLNSSDMNNFDIRNIIQVNHVYYRINKLTHNPLTDEAEVELIKIKAFVPVTNNIVYSTLGSSIDGTNTPTPINIGGVKIPPPVTVTPGGFPWKPRPRPPYEVITNTPYWEEDSPIAGGTFNPSFEVDEIWSTKSAALWQNNSNGQTPTGVFSPTSNYDVNNNIFSPQSTRDIMGSNNYVDPSSSRVRVSGSNNRVMANATNVTIQGDNNEVGPGLTNVSIVGDNQTVSESNVAIMNGLVIKNGVSRRNTALIKSVIDEVGTKTSCVMRGGKNSVMTDSVIKGGQDTSY